MDTVRFRLAVCRCGYYRQFPQDEGTQLPGNGVLYSDGIIRVGGIQAVIRRSPGFGLLDYCRRGMLYHRSCFLLPTQYPLYAFRLSFLRIGRVGMPHGGGVVHLGEDAIALLKDVNIYPLSLLFCFTTYTFVVLYTSATLQQDDTDREFKLWL